MELEEKLVKFVTSDIRVDVARAHPLNIWGQTQALCKELEFDKDEQEQVLAEMLESDYLHLLEVFIKYFGDWISRNDRQYYENVLEGSKKEIYD